MFVEEYMIKDPATVTPDDSLADARRIMDLSRVLELPVVDENGRLVGIISDRDLRSAAGFDATLAEGLSVGEVMTAEPVTVTPDFALDEAVAILCARRFGAMPVVRGDRVVGLLTQFDALMALQKVLGLDQEGSRIEVALPEGVEDLTRVFAALEPLRDRLISAVVSTTRSDGDEPALYLRVAPEAVAEAEQRLRKATLILLKPEEPGS